MERKNLERSLIIDWDYIILISRLNSCRVIDVLSGLIGFYYSENYHPRKKCFSVFLWMNLPLLLPWDSPHASSSAANSLRCRMKPFAFELALLAFLILGATTLTKTDHHHHLHHDLSSLFYHSIIASINSIGKATAAACIWLLQTIFNKLCLFLNFLICTFYKFFR